VSDFLERIAKLSPKRLALLAMELNNKLGRLEQRAAEPIAVTGIGCRFPGGANDPDSFWRLLIEGRDAIGEVPPRRVLRSRSRRARENEHALGRLPGWD
jgi:myxalamid-type polyketide synthase MxaE